MSRYSVMFAALTILVAAACSDEPQVPHAAVANPAGASIRADRESYLNNEQAAVSLTGFGACSGQDIAVRLYQGPYRVSEVAVSVAADGTAKTSLAMPPRHILALTLVAFGGCVPGEEVAWDRYILVGPAGAENRIDYATMSYFHDTPPDIGFVVEAALGGISWEGPVTIESPNGPITIPKARDVRADPFGSCGDGLAVYFPDDVSVCFNFAAATYVLENGGGGSERVARQIIASATGFSAK